MGLDETLVKRRQLAALLRSVDRFAAGDVAIGGLLLAMKGLTPLFTDEPWKREFEAAFSELEGRYALAASRAMPLPTMADGEVAAVVGHVSQTARSYSQELER